jgi:uncharacterized protein
VSISPFSRRRKAFARRPLLLVLATAALVAVSLIAQQSSVMTRGASAQVRGTVSKTPPKVAPAPSAPSTSVVLSQVYGGAGCGTAGCSTYKNDYIELFNRGASPQSLNGWSVQYAAATGTAWQVTNLTNVTLQPGQYYLVGEGAGANGVNNIPTADATGTIAMSATAAKVALVNTTTALSGACPASASIVDLIGYGSTATCFETAVAPAPSTTTADVRASGGCTDTDNNSTDFTATTPNPRNTSTALAACGGVAQPNLSVNDVSQDEGNAGTTAFTFTVSISATSASNVTFNWNTADGTATAPGDYTAVVGGSGTITAGNTSTTITVNVNGDAADEPNETFFVNISNVVGATASDAQGQGTIQNDDAPITPVYTIQGSGTASPLVGTNVTTTGVVTGIKAGSSGGFFIQDPTGDGNPNTSDGVFVFTGASVPAGAVVGNLVRVSGTVQEFVFASDPNSPPITEISSVTNTAVISTGNPLPAPHTITAAETTAASGTTNPLDSLEEFEGMRVTVPSLTVTGPTQGTITEPSATVSTSGVFYAVVTGVARPFREAGVNVSDPLPAGAPANVPRFDENPERIRVDSDGQPGTSPINVSAGTTVSNVTGPLDYQFRTYTILPDTTLTGTNSGATPAPLANSNEFTVASFNMERFFDTTDDPSTSDPVLTATAFNNRLNKASLIIRNVQRYPDVIGVEEMENLTTLQSVAAKVNSDAQTIDGLPNPQYTAYLVEGNDVGGIDVGFLVKQSRVSFVDVTQFGKATTFTNPDNSTALLNDRPPLVLRATINRPAGGTLPFTVIVNHLRSLSGVDDTTAGPNGWPTEGARIRAKRRAQAEFLANLIQSRQAADPAEKIITVGDMNAFRVNDGYVDVIGTVLGSPAPADQVVLASGDLVEPNQTDLVDTLTADQRYSYTFDGNAQTLDHVIVNPNALAILDRFAYAREDADQPVADYGDPSVPDRISDHDQPVAYFSLVAPQPAGSLVVSEFRLRGQSGVTDEYVELYNNTDSDMSVSTTDGSPGWALVASDGQTRFIIPNGTTILARQHFLGVNRSGYTLDTYAFPDNILRPDGVTVADGYNVDIPDGSGLALFRTSNPANFTLAERLDAVGYTSAPALYREGAGLPTGGQEFGNDLEYAWIRQQCAFVNGVGCTTPGTPKDSGDNASDFISVDTTGVLQSLGAPGPESSGSPFMRNASFGFTLLDAGRSASQPPNRDRDFTPGDPNNAAQGTLTIRRTVTNNTGSTISYIAFRIIQITTAPENATDADLRALDSEDVTVSLSDGTPVPVRGTFVEGNPPSQPLGGALNTSMAVGYISIDGNTIADGESFNVQFVLGVMKPGPFRFLINIEAFDETPVPESPDIKRALKRGASTGPSKTGVLLWPGSKQKP